ncbi:LacI family DNA-binding transcriptional regulator [Marinitoga sp. 38H-ov]|uniref:LacI family DNA-binding transcriptional regulator n=1 Tax=Marinitoga sp. 38H-ov TaxID=1755814 RepID=UPI0013EB4A78|nr:LacI family DNA-binding transcriptional regulator [Marinitoga sp. 38H-ov]KAF2955360.1 alanine racemase [Marinitoga sp. 38H-ov]
MKNIRDVAKKANVSIATVSRVINGHDNVSEKTKKKVLKAMRDLNYRPAPSYRNTRLFKTIAILIPNLKNSHYGEIVMGVESAARENGFDLFISITSENPDMEYESIENFFERKIDGIILSEFFIEKEKLEKFQKLNIPIVIADFKDDSVFLDSVNTDNFNGAYKAMQFLYDNGHRNILHIPGPNWSPAARDRINGINEFIKNNNDVKISFTSNRGYFPNAGRIAIKNYLKDKGLNFTAIFAVNDLIAVSVIDELKRQNINVPEDVSVIGFDDSPIAEYFYPYLTTIRQFRWDIGYTAAKLLIEKILNPKSTLPRKILIPTELIIRDSVKKIN